MCTVDSVQTTVYTCTVEHPSALNNCELVCFLTFNKDGEKEKKRKKEEEKRRLQAFFDLQHRKKKLSVSLSDDTGL